MRKDMASLFCAAKRGKSRNARLFPRSAAQKSRACPHDCGLSIRDIKVEAVKLNTELLKKAEEIVNKSTMYALGNILPDKTGWEADWVMALTDEEGFPSASMITASKADGFKWISFCTGLGGHKVNRVKKDPRACIYLFDNKSFTGISLAGRIEIIVDVEVKKQMWYDALGNHFHGPDDSALCILMFTPKKYNIFINNQTLYGAF